VIGLPVTACHVDSGVGWVVWSIDIDPSEAEPQTRVPQVKSEMGEGHWSFTRASGARMFGVFGKEHVAAESHGNVFAAVACFTASPRRGGLTPTQVVAAFTRRSDGPNCSSGLGSSLRNHSFDDALHLLSNQEDFMRRIIIGLSAIAITALPTMALADGDGALTGAAGGAVAGAVVGGPVGAAVGGVAGGVIGGAASGPAPVVVAPGPAPCNTRTTTTQNNNTGASVTRQTTDCAD
jgi:hypothetical protein